MIFNILNRNKRNTNNSNILYLITDLKSFLEKKMKGIILSNNKINKLLFYIKKSPNDESKLLIEK